ncbi:MAG: phage tail protein [Oscillospiraceae bacterium]|nr:phage tail protein [Oscillospiraceae bacterium]
MAVIGYLGTSAEEGLLFQVSSKTVETLKNMTWSGSARYAVHQRHLTHALTEFVGLDPDKITFDITFLAELGVNPMDEVTKLWKYKREGTALQLVLGEHGYGKYRWTVVSFKIKVEYTDVNGDIYASTVSVSLQEYLSKDF